MPPFEMLQRRGHLIWHSLRGIRYYGPCKIIRLHWLGLYEVNLENLAYCLVRRVEHLVGHIFQSKLIRIYFSQPEGRYIGVGFFFRNIVNDDDSMGSLVICSGDGPKSFLTSGIPDLQFDDVSIYCDRSTQ